MLRDDFDAAIASYLQDSTSRKYEVYDSIQQWMNGSKDTSRIKASVDTAFFDLMFNGQKVARLYNKFWPADHSINLGKLETDALKFSYLDGLYGPVKQLVTVDDPSLITAPPPSNFYESYIKLLFSHSPHHVPRFLDNSSKVSTMTMPLNLIDVLATTYNLTDAKLWVMMQKRDFKGALELAIEKMKIKFQEGNMQKSDIDRIVMICQQAKAGDNDVWNMFLYQFCFKLFKIPSVSSNIWHSAFTIAMKHISIPDILLELFERESRSSISQNIPLILFLMDGFEYEVNSLEKTLALSDAHTFEEFKRLVDTLKCSYSPALGQCQLCRKFFHLRAMTMLEQRDDIVVCKCQHSFHMTCLLDVLEKAHFRMQLPGLVDDYDLWCVICGSGPSDKRKKGKQAQIFTSMVPIACHVSLIYM
jgi:hypothetical protein